MNIQFSLARRRIWIALLVLIFSAAPLLAAPGIAPRWAKTYGGSVPGDAGTAQYLARDRPSTGGGAGGDDQARQVTFDTAGNLFVAEQATSTAKECHLLKLAAADGSILWDRIVDTTDITACLTDDAGNVIAGSYRNGVYYVAKFAGTDGTLLWSSTGESTAYGLRMALDHWGNVLLMVNILVDPDNSGAEGGTIVIRPEPPVPLLEIVKLAAADGTVVWKESWGYGSLGSGSVLAADSQGNVLLGYEVYGATEVMKMAAADGRLLWYKAGVPGVVTELQVASNDDVVFVVDTTSKTNIAYYPETVPPIPNLITDRYAAADGSLVWEQTLPNPENVRVPIGLRLDKAGDVFVVTSSGGNGNLIAKYSGSQGQPCWTQLLTDGVASGLALTTSGDLVLTGSIPAQGSLYLALVASSDGSLTAEHRYQAPGLGFATSGAGPLLVAAGPGGTVALAGEASAATGLHDLALILYEPTTRAPAVNLIGPSPVQLADGATTYVDAGATAVDADGGPLDPTLLPPPGQTSPNLFPLPQPGVYRANWIAIDANGLIGGASRTVREIDSSPPVITATDLTLEATSNGGTLVPRYSVTYTDADPYVTLSYDPPSTFFRLGTNTVTVTAKDSSGNSSTSSFHVTVQDTRPPLIGIQQVNLFATSATGAQVSSYPDGAIFDADDHLTITYDPPGPEFLPLGTTHVKVTAIDSSGNSSQGEFDVVVSLRSPPALSAKDLILEANAADGNIVDSYPVILTSSDPAAVLNYDLSAPRKFAIGTTQVTATLTDSEGQVAVTTFHVTVRDTTPPRLIQLRSTLISPGILADYRALALFSDVSPMTVVQIPAPGTVVPSGPLQIVFTATDAYGNQSNATLPVTVGQLTAEAMRKGDPVPQAGGVDGVPADARFVSFGVPAIDDLENLAYTGAWKKDAQHGTSLIAGSRCVATLKQPAPGLAGTTFASFDAPVIDNGNVAFIAHLAGKEAGNAVCTDALTGELAVLAKTGTPAVGLAGEKFASFRTVSVVGSAVAFQGRAVDRAGRGIVGVWMADAVHPLQLIVSEGATVSGHKIKTLAPFNPGSGSPGQGRGWLLARGGVPAIHALALCTDGAQLLFSGGFEAAPVAAVTAKANANLLRSFGLPAWNTLGNSVSLATRSALAGDTAPGSRDLFSFEAAGETPAPLEYIGGNVDLATVRALGDPVLAPGDGGLAFIATLKPTTGAARPTLLWAPPGEALQELAHVGGTLSDFPGATWKAFSSLAISTGHGPILRATLGGEGRNRQGLWATDSLGNFQRIFLLGDQVDGQTLSAFTVLNATPGSAGVTRSVNGRGEIAWRAQFTGGNEELIVTKVP